MFQQSLDALVTAKTVSEEEQAIGELLKAARRENVDYGYKVYSVTSKRDVPVSDVHNHLDDKLEVTLMIGSEPPYKEIRWSPRYNGHITRIVMP